jgi:hypothetical protein
VLSGKSLHVFSAENGELLGSIDGLTEALSVILPTFVPEPGGVELESIEQPI